MSDNLPSLFVVVGSTSPSLRYDSGSWTSLVPTSRMLNPAIFGKHPISDKLSTLANGHSEGSVLYNFTDVTGISVSGTVDLAEQSYAPSEAPRIYCDITPSEGVSGTGLSTMVPVSTAPWHSHSIVFCTFENLSASISYTLNLTLVQKIPQQIWLDAVAFAPAPDARLDNATTFLLPKSPLIHYSAGWSSMMESIGSYVTSTNGSTVSFDFNGTSVKWFTAWQEGMGTEGSQGTWTVDGRYSQTFNIPGINSDDNGFHVPGMLLFQTPDFPPGPHHLEVTYTPDSNSNETRPLALSSLLVQNAVPLGVPGDDTAGSRHSNGKITAIVLGVSIPGAILFITLAILWYRRHQRPKRAEVDYAQALTSAISPYDSRFQGHNPTSSKQKQMHAMDFESAMGSSAQLTSWEISTTSPRGLEDEPPPYQATSHQSAMESPSPVKSGLPNFDIEGRAAYMDASLALQASI